MTTRTLCMILYIAISTAAVFFNKHFNCEIIQWNSKLLPAAVQTTGHKIPLFLSP